MTNAQRAFAEYLGSKKLKLTRERKAVLEEIFLRRGHLEAEDLASRLRKKKKRASRATIYRTLELLVESGIVRRVDLGHGHSHYELILDHPHHEHMICANCGKVIEFSDKAIEQALGRLCSRKGFEPTSHRLQIFGYCDNCKGPVRSPQK
ncbi:MAG: transcriptional repressor [candidate division Zixibacteria bacterium]|nr:transcriptional repressor [candidate division Zixibacteria bacterium]